MGVQYVLRTIISLGALARNQVLAGTCWNYVKLLVPEAKTWYEYVSFCLSLSLFWFHLLCFFIFILLLCSEHQYDQYALPGSADGGHQRNKVLDNDTHAELKTDAPKISMLSLRVGT